MPEQDQPLELNLPGKIQEVLPDLQDIQPLLLQVCNFDKILSDLNVSWCKMLFPYKLFTGDKIWRIQTREISPLLCTELIYTHINEQCFFLPVLVQQSTHSITTYTVIV